MEEGKNAPVKPSEEKTELVERLNDVEQRVTQIERELGILERR